MNDEGIQYFLLVMYKTLLVNVSYNMGGSGRQQTPV